RAAGRGARRARRAPRRRRRRRAPAAGSARGRIRPAGRGRVRAVARHRGPARARPRDRRRRGSAVCAPAPVAGGSGRGGRARRLRRARTGSRCARGRGRGGGRRRLPRRSRRGGGGARGAPRGRPAVPAGRFLPTALGLGHGATGRVAEVALGGMRLGVEPEGVAPLGAIAPAADAVRDIPPDETVLAFPACGMVPFVAGRPPAGPHDYFYPGRPDRAEAALLAARLAARPPRLAVPSRAAGTAPAGAWNDSPELLALLA